VEQPRVVDAVEVHNQRIRQGAEVHQLGPVPVVPRQPRGFQAEDRPTPASRHDTGAPQVCRRRPPRSGAIQNPPPGAQPGYTTVSHQESSLGAQRVKAMATYHVAMALTSAAPEPCLPVAGSQSSSVASIVEDEPTSAPRAHASSWARSSRRAAMPQSGFSLTAIVAHTSACAIHSGSRFTTPSLSRTSSDTPSPVRIRRRTSAR